MTLPDDISTALTDGVILCHLANHVRPRSVASIHVPSPGVVRFYKIYKFVLNLFIDEILLNLISD